MNKISAVLGTMLAGCIAMTDTQGSKTSQPQPKVVVGAFDSRAVVTAYVRSDAFSEYVSAQKDDISRAIERARGVGDLQIVADLEALGPAMQRRIKRQGFGAAPADEVLAKIADKLPGIAAKAGVDVIVSKWQLAYRDPNARFVDVTELLAAEFDPDEKTLQVIRELVATEPVRLDQFKADHR